MDAISRLNQMWDVKLWMNRLAYNDNLSHEFVPVGNDYLWIDQVVIYVAGPFDILLMSGWPYFVFKMCTLIWFINEHSSYHLWKRSTLGLCPCLKTVGSGNMYITTCITHEFLQFSKIFLFSFLIYNIHIIIVTMGMFHLKIIWKNQRIFMKLGIILNSLT